MNNIWFPVPVSLFFRRVVNVLSTLSITHHYLLPQRSTDGNGTEVPSRLASRVVEAGRHVPWTTIVENGLGGILQASGKLYIPWFRWPARLSLFHPDVQQFDDGTSAKNNHLGSNPNCDPRPQGPTEPADPGRDNREDPDEIHRLMQNPVLYNPLRAPRYPIVLCHGLYGFDVRGPSSFPSLRMHYWSSILGILRKTVGAEVIVTAVPGTGSIASRAEQLNRFLQIKALGRGINFMAHSMGGLDCRHLITHIKPVEYTPLSLTTIATPHRGSPFMDWCKEYLGLGRRRLGEEKKSTVVTATDVRAMSAAATEATTNSYFASGATSPSPVAERLSFSSLPSSFTTFLLGMFDSPAYANLTTAYLNEIFNPYTPNDPRVRYFSVAGRTGSLNIWHPLWLPKLVLDGADRGEGHDGLVSVDSACWGEFLGTLEGADHWALRGASGIELGVDLPSVVSDAWGLAHWGRAVRGLRRTKQRTAEEEDEGMEGARRASEERKGDRMAGDERPVSEEELKSSTDRLSAVFDWLVEQVPVASRNAFSFAGDGDGGARGGNGAGSGAGSGAGNNNIPDATGGRRTPLNKRRRDLDSKGDLERLYVALARKLYDEGL